MLYLFKNQNIIEEQERICSNADCQKNDMTCECGRVQDDNHIDEWPNFEELCREEDVKNAIKLATYWTDKI